MSRKYAIVLLVGALLFIIVLPLFGQTAPADPDSQVVVVGTLDLGQGVIMVGENIVAPASAFQPSAFHQGDLVVVIGYLLPDGVTIQATSMELFDEENPPFEVTEEPTEEATLEPTEEITPEATVEVTEEPTEEVTPEATVEVTLEAGCTQTRQPVAQRLADSFGVSYNEIINWHCNGFGFGEIARAYLLADASGEDPATYFSERGAGMGWGQIVKEAGVHPSDLAPGQVIRPGHDGDTQTEEQSSSQPGNGNGHGNGNGNGNGNGRSNGNGNGRGNGNGHGNGHGHG